MEGEREGRSPWKGRKLLRTSCERLSAATRREGVASHLATRGCGVHVGPCSGHEPLFEQGKHPPQLVRVALRPREAHAAPLLKSLLQLLQPHHPLTVEGGPLPPLVPCDVDLLGPLERAARDLSVELCSAEPAAVERVVGSAEQEGTFLVDIREEGGGGQGREHPGEEVVCLVRS